MPPLNPDLSLHKRQTGPAAGIVAAVAAIIILAIFVYILKRTFHTFQTSKTTTQPPLNLRLPAQEARGNIPFAGRSEEPVVHDDPLPKYEPPPPPYQAHLRDA